MVNFNTAEPGNWNTEQLINFIENADKISEGEKITYQSQTGESPIRLESGEVVDLLINMVNKGLDQDTASHVYSQLKLDPSSQSKWIQFEAKIREAGAGSVLGQDDDSSFAPPPLLKPPGLSLPTESDTKTKPQDDDSSFAPPPLLKPPGLSLSDTESDTKTKAQDDDRALLRPPGMQRTATSRREAPTASDKTREAQERIAKEIARQRQNPSKEQQEHDKWYMQIMSMTYEQVVAYANDSSIDIAKRKGALSLLHTFTPPHLAMHRRDIYELQIELEKF